MTVDVRMGPADHWSERGKWESILAVGLVLGDLRSAVVARYTNVSVGEVDAAVARAQEAGLLDEHGGVDPFHASELMLSIESWRRSEITGLIGRQLLTATGDHLDEVVAHTRSLALNLDRHAMIEALEQAGRSRATLGDGESARRLLSVAVDLDLGDDPVASANRMIALAIAHKACGDLGSARELLTNSFSLAEAAGYPEIAVRAAVLHALPVDFHAGDLRSLALLRRVAAMDLGPVDAAVVMALQGMVEMRVPVADAEDQQYAWITRPEIAQPLTDAAIEVIGPDYAEARAFALLAWRSTHRAPRHLARRREVTDELMETAHLAGDPGLSVVAAAQAAVDAIEAGDRSSYDRFRAIARWNAEREGAPQARWRALTLEAGAAHLDGDVSRARMLARQAHDAVSGSDAERWALADEVFAGQAVIDREQANELESLAAYESVPLRVNPVAQATFAYACARAGAVDRARDLLQRSVRRLDEESSLLLLASRATAAAVALGDREVLETLIGVMGPYADHVVVDAHAWWVDGPVAGWLAEGYLALGDTANARSCSAQALEIARRIGDVRSLARLEAMGRRLGGVSVTSGRGEVAVGGIVLTEREHAVLELMAQGASNPEIAKTLCYSVSTIRDATVSIYRKLGVKTRSSAVVAATRLGLLRF